MKLNEPRHPWSRLTAAARIIQEAREESAPYGFATRVAALACAQERVVTSLLERFALRAVAFSALIAVLSVAVNYGDLTAPPSSVVAMEEFSLPTHDAVAFVLDLAD
jgi:hypothetical protein